MKNPKSYLKFVSAVRATGRLPHFDLGGGVGLSSVAPQGTPGQGTKITGISGALTPQSAFTAQLAPTQFLNYAPVANQAVAQGTNTYNQIGANINQEQGLENTFGAQVNGGGPNPAQAALAQNTATNVANQAALAAGQRGASSNAGLIARQVGQAGAGTEQQAVGQAATLQAQQQIAAEQNQAAIQGQIGQQLGQQQAGATNLLGTAANATNAQNQASIANYSNTQGINAATAAANAQASQKTGGGLLGGLSSAIGSLFYQGGEVGHYADGGAASPSSFVANFLKGNTSSNNDTFATGLQTLGSKIGSDIKGAFSSPTAAPLDQATQNLQDSAGTTSLTSPLQQSAGTILEAKGGKVPAMVSPGEQYLPPADVKKVEKGANPLQVGERIPGKPKVKGNSLKNDTVPKLLEAGGVVIPNDIMQSKDAPNKAARFVQAIQAKQGLKRKR
jgi:hypothetical protein